MSHFYDNIIISHLVTFHGIKISLILIILSNISANLENNSNIDHYFISEELPIKCNLPPYQTNIQITYIPNFGIKDILFKKSTTL